MSVEHVESNEGCFSRLSDKYHGVKMCEMTQMELEEFLGAIARRGAADALKAVGLDDSDAVADVRDLRDILRGFRVVKKNVWSTTLTGTGRIIGWAIVVAIASLFVGHSQAAKDVVKMLAN